MDLMVLNMLLLFLCCDEINRSLSIHIMPLQRNGQAQMPGNVLGDISIHRKATDHYNSANGEWKFHGYTDIYLFKANPK